MYTNMTSTAAAWAFSATGTSSAFGSNSGEGDAFSKLFSSIRDGASSGLDDILGKLSDRFPGLSFKTPASGTGAGSAANGEAASEEVKDTAEIDENALAEMAASESFSSLIEKALSSFLDATKDMQSSMNGVNTIRSISITVTTVRFSVNQQDSASGETLMSQEFQTALKDKIDEMIKKVFGGGAGGETEETDDEVTEPAKANENASKFGLGMSGWSMSLYYSQSYLQSNAGDSSMQSQSAGFSMWSFVGSTIPKELTTLMNEGEEGGMRDFMAGFGFSMSSFSQTQDGFSMRFGESRNLLSELMEILNQRNNQRPLPATAPEEEEDAAAEAATEVEAAPVAAE